MRQPPVVPGPPSSAISLRTTGALLVAGGGLAVIGNLLHPRFRGADVDVYRHIATSSRFTVADVVILAALLLVTLGFYGLVDSIDDRGVAGRLATLATVTGGTIALAQTAVELFALRQQARIFADAGPSDQVGAFWSAVSLDKLNSALFALWVVLLLGLAAFALAYAGLISRRQPRAVALLGLVGAAGCIGIGMYDLLASDQSNVDVPFVIASLLVTGWILVTGCALSLQSPRTTQPTHLGAGVEASHV